MSLSPEELLLRWVNYHLQNAGTQTIRNFSEDIKDSRAYFYLLDQIAQHEEKAYNSSLRIDMSGLNVSADSLYVTPPPVKTRTVPPVCLFVQEQNLEQRAELMLQQAARLDCRQFVSPHDVTSGNSKLNLAFVANLFNMHPALERADLNGMETMHIEGEARHRSALSPQKVGARRRSRRN